MPEQEKVSAESVKLGYEARDASARGILLTGVLALVAGFLIHVMLWRLFLAYKLDLTRDQHPLSALPSEDRLPPEPRLELNPHEDLKELRRHDLRILETAGWVDRKQGWVRIPIEEAIHEVAAEDKARRSRR